ncbi:MAG TPA: FAD-dependent oxidoreductase [Gemmatimonadaceae bacterium]|nr:FAD-dependent oxidoreductase [Gemmatimonadaceae bacterium]
MIRAECDVLVIGGGPAGIAAASRAAELGARALLVDEGLAPGGQIWRESRGGRRGGAARRWIARLARSGAAIRSSTSVVDVDSVGGRFLVVADSQGELVSIDAGAIVLATGARELFLPFPGWTLPNIFGVGGGQALMKSGMPVRGRRVVVAGTGPLVLAVAASFASHGARVRAVAEQAPLARVAKFAAALWRAPSRAGQALALRASLGATRYFTGTWVSRADGDSRVRSVTLTDGRHTRAIECDILCTALGLLPNVELARFLGCRVRSSGVQADALQATSVDSVFCAGEPTGIGGVDLSLVEGEIAGGAAVGATPSRRLTAARERLRREADLLASTFALRPDVFALANDDTIVCRCEDVRFGDLDRSWSFRQAKLYTRIGMGPCQGRVCAAAVECLWGWPREVPRPPIQPTRVAALLGAHDASLT